MPHPTVGFFLLSVMVHLSYDCTVQKIFKYDQEQRQSVWAQEGEK